MASATRIAVIALGLAVGALAIALYLDGDRQDLTGGVILLGALALALVIIGAVVTPGSPRSRRR